MSKPWVTIGAWAAEAERAEAEELEQEAAGAEPTPQSFPSLKEAAANKPKKKKKMSLQEFTMQSTGGGDRRDSAYDLRDEEMLRLPTGPKVRSPEEMQYGRQGRGFSNYGQSGSPSGRTGPNRDGDGDAASWGGGRRPYGGFEDDHRALPSRRASEFDNPSRADEVDNWAMEKKPVPSLDSARPNRYGSLGGGVGGGGTSRADEADNWGVGKKPIPSRSSTFGSGFRDFSQRPRLVFDPPRNDGAAAEPALKTNRPNPFGAARPREEVLAGKGLDWKKMDSEIEANKSSRPPSPQSSRPSSTQLNLSELAAVQGTDGAAKPGPKVNPFGDAKPREVLLEERGMDWRKLDMELERRGVDRPHTEAEKNLKEEIDHLKKELEIESSANANRESPEGSGQNQNSLRDLLRSKERDMDLLIRELDDKVRFGQKGHERPGSGAGRVSEFPDRPSPRSGAFEESRSREFMEMSRSRGSGHDGRALQAGRDKGFLSNRDIGRSRSRSRSRGRW